MNGMGILIPVMGILCGIIAIVGNIWVRSQRLKLDIMRAQRGDAAAQGEVTAELQRLKERVAVLERLLTDDDRKLANEIERLRRTETNPPA